MFLSWLNTISKFLFIYLTSNHGHFLSESWFHNRVIRSPRGLFSKGVIFTMIIKLDFSRRLNFLHFLCAMFNVCFDFFLLPFLNHSNFKNILKPLKHYISFKEIILVQDSFKSSKEAVTSQNNIVNYQFYCNLNSNQFFFFF